MPVGLIQANVRIAVRAPLVVRQKLLLQAKTLFLGFFGLLFLLLVSTSAAGAEEVSFPVIARLDTKDPVFKQYTADVELARRGIYGKNQDSDELAGILHIYLYHSAADEDLFRLAARCNVPYSALATLNRIGHPSLFKGGGLLLPSVPGLFLAETPNGDFEQLIAASRTLEGGTIITVPGKGRYYFLPGEDFHPVERAFFLNTGFNFPLKNYRLTSSYGMRASPINGKLQRHNGLDLAAPAGTEVYAARAGRVVKTGTDPVYGNYILIAHEDDWVSLYGHLSAFLVEANSHVTRSSPIGKVGSTGQSTGPHLHFEIRKNGAALDPGKMLYRNL
jgi:hypothetical protein